MLKLSNVFITSALLYAIVLISVVNDAMVYTESSTLIYEFS